MTRNIIGDSGAEGGCGLEISVQRWLSRLHIDITEGSDAVAGISSRMHLTGNSYRVRRARIRGGSRGGKGMEQKLEKSDKKRGPGYVDIGDHGLVGWDVEVMGTRSMEGMSNAWMHEIEM